MFDDFYNRLIRLYSNENKCIFYKMWNFELQRPNEVYRKNARDMFKYKPYRENNDLDSTVAVSLYSPILSKLEYNCEYFGEITKEEFDNPNSSFNSIIYKIFNRHKPFLVNELENEMEKIIE